MKLLFQSKPVLPLTRIHSHAIITSQQQMVQETVPLLLIFIKEAFFMKNFAVFIHHFTGRTQTL